MSDLRVLVVSRDPLARAGLTALLGQQQEPHDSIVVGQVNGDEDLEPGLEAYRPDVVLWDLGWDPAAALERLAELTPDGPPVLALLADSSQAAATWAAGAQGLLLREIEPTLLHSALAAAARGLVVLDPSLAGATPTVGSVPATPVPELTNRELETLRLLAEGLPNKVIASRLGISEHTVKFHVNSIMGKLGAQSRTEAVTQAMRLGLVLL